MREHRLTIAKGEMLERWRKKKGRSAAQVAVRKESELTKKTLSVELPEDFHELFVKTVTEADGPWRGGRPYETFASAIESAAYAALMFFLQGLNGGSELPEFREYAAIKYPHLDEDLVTMMADLIERETGK